MAPLTLLGVQIAYGFSPEARVFATLLAGRDGCYAARVLHQWSSHDPDAAGQFERLAGLAVERIDVGFRYSPRGFARVPVQVGARARRWISRRQLLRYAMNGDVSVVYGSQQRWDSAIAESLSRKAGRPLIIHLHYNVGPWLGDAVLARLKRAAHIVTVSDFIRDQVIQFGIAPGRVTTVRNTMPAGPEPDAATRADVRAELGIPQDATLIGCVARLDRWKGQADAIAAFSQIADRYPGARLLLAGDGDIRGELEEQAARAGVSGRVTFAGFRDDVPRILAALDIFLHPALSDPCPLGVLEASAAGLPVVGYQHGGMPELIASGETGLLVRASDVAGLADALGALACDPSRARTLGIAGRERIRREFLPADAAARFADLLDAVAVRST